MLRDVVYDGIVEEANALIPHLLVLQGYYPPCVAIPRGRTGVVRAVSAIVDWLEKEPGHLRRAIEQFSIGGQGFRAHVDGLCFGHYLSVCGREQAIRDATARLLNSENIDPSV